MSKEPLISVRDLSLTINNKILLKDINLDVFPKEILTIVGPNGGGKTMLLKTILSLIKPTRGKVNVKKKLKIGYMPQKMHISSLMPITVERFLKLSSIYRKFCKFKRYNAISKTSKKSDLASNLKHRNLNIAEYIDSLGVSKILKSQMLDLSGGELQRVLFARALLNEPELLILDEPAQGVDAKGQVELYSKIANIRDTQNCAIIIVSHDLHLVAAQTNKVVCLNKHICCRGYPESVCKHPEFVKLFGYGDITKLAVYAHAHDHSHDINGNIITKDNN